MTDEEKDQFLIDLSNKYHKLGFQETENVNMQADSLRYWYDLFLRGMQPKDIWTELESLAPVPPISISTPDPIPTPTPNLTPKPIHVSGKAFYTEDGWIFKYHGASYFRMFRHYLDERDLDPVFNWARALGVNTFRVFTVLSWANLKVDSYSDSQLLEFAQFVHSKGFRLEIVALADCGILGMNLDAQKRQVNRVRDILSSLPIFKELANEPSMNGVDPLAFSYPGGGIWSRGSSHGGQDAISPGWNYGTDHTPRDGEWPRKAKNCFEYAEALGIPYIADEPPKIGVNTLDPSDCEDYSAVADLLVSGSTIHTQSLGINGVLPSGIEQSCCESWSRAWQIIPPDAQLGRYTAGHLPNCPLVHYTDKCLRVFATIQDNKATAVMVRNTGPVVAKNGWRIINQKGSVIFLERN